METWSSPAFSQRVKSLPPAVIIKPHVASTFHAPSVPRCLVRVPPPRVLGITLKLRCSPCLPVSQHLSTQHQEGSVQAKVQSSFITEAQMSARSIGIADRKEEREGECAEGATVV